jgi:hypothetical protein
VIDMDRQRIDKVLIRRLREVIVANGTGDGVASQG